MLKGHNIICISTIDWDFIWQGHQEIMSVFAEKGNRVLFIENTGVRTPGIKDMPRIYKRIKNWLKGITGIRKVKENIYVFSPIILPFPYLKIARWFNKRLVFLLLSRWMRVMDFSDSVIWTFLPTGFALDLINGIDNKCVVYYCIDNFAASSKNAKKVKNSEIKLIKDSDLVFVTAKALYDYCSLYKDKVHIFPFGVNIKSFEIVRDSKGQRVPEDIKNIKKPIIGYIGGIHKWVNISMVKELALLCPDYSFVLVGPVQADISELMNIRNIYLLGAKEHEKLPHYIKAFDVCTIPYVIAEYTNNVYPTKLNEYLSMGKPVISTELPEVVNFNRNNENIIDIAGDAADFKASIEAVISHEVEQHDISDRIRAANKNTWSARISEMSSLVEREIEAKFCKRDSMWLDNLKL